MPNATMSKRRKLRELIDKNKLLFCPGIYDPLGARVVNEYEFEAIYMSGAGTSIGKIGYPDAGFITMTEMCSNASNIQEAVDIPVIADADTGYGDVKNIVRTVREYIKSGVGAIHIEDQSFPKRCGQLKGKQILSKEEALGKYRAASDERDERDEDFVIIARTDAYGVADGTIDEAIERANAYCEAGADVAFVEGPTTREEVEYVGEHVNYPLLYNYGSISPRIDLEKLESLGYDIAIYNFAHRATLPALFNSVESLKGDPIEEMNRLSDITKGLPIKSRHIFSGFDEVVELEKEYLPDNIDEIYDQSTGEEVR